MNNCFICGTGLSRGCVQFPYSRLIWLSTPEYHLATWHYKLSAGNLVKANMLGNPQTHFINTLMLVNGQNGNIRCSLKPHGIKVFIGLAPGMDLKSKQTSRRQITWQARNKEMSSCLTLLKVSEFLLGPN